MKIAKYTKEEWIFCGDRVGLLAEFQTWRCSFDVSFKQNRGNKIPSFCFQ